MLCLIFKMMNQNLPHQFRMFKISCLSFTEVPVGIYSKAFKVFFPFKIVQIFTEFDFVCFLFAGQAIVFYYDRIECNCFSHQIPFNTIQIKLNCYSIQKKISHFVFDSSQFVHRVNHNIFFISFFQSIFFILQMKNYLPVVDIQKH